MSVLTFDELTHRLENELHRLHYTEGSIAGYRRAWKHIASFLDNEYRGPHGQDHRCINLR